ncbi:MAG: phytanoyl-CoA dioxygenase family protein [Phycisphaeraceae bacterium]|nr:phytanoyl-CoA dioxygenase family protein [Phycisphaeraceae bacterium]
MPATTASTFRVTAAHRQQLTADGFFVTPVIFDEATIASVRSEMERIWGEQIEQAQRNNADAITLDQIRYRPFIARLQEYSEPCAAFCRHPIILDLCRDLIGPDADMTWNQTIIKPPASRDQKSTITARDNAFAWHQDQWYALKGDYAKDSNVDLLTAPGNGFTMWVAISRTTVDNGTLWVLPGRHREGLLEHEWSTEKREWQGKFDTSWKIPAVMRPGQALIFDKYLPHGSSTNVSNETRIAYQIGYMVPGLKKGPSPDLVPVMRGGVGV